MALSDCVKECVWMRRLLKDIGAEQVGATVIYEDNQGAMALAKNVGYQARTKPIDIRYHFIREKVVSNEVELEYVDTKNQLADFMTKGLSSKTLLEPADEDKHRNDGHSIYWLHAPDLEHARRWLQKYRRKPLDS
ncbi:hypothetical protein PF003_g14985 [Phytophthora fragariae]|nr:hypothetical protein PF003_g14985 [Phytophthora fragariae]